MYMIYILRISVLHLRLNRGEVYHITKGGLCDVSISSGEVRLDKMYNLPLVTVCQRRIP